MSKRTITPLARKFEVVNDEVERRVTPLPPSVRQEVAIGTFGGIKLTTLVSPGKIINPVKEAKRQLKRLGR